MIEDKEILFKETQRFTQWWLWFPLVCFFVYFIYNSINQVVIHKVFGEKPTSDVGLVFPNTLLFLVMLLFWNIRLETTINNAGISVKLFPFHFKFRFFPFSSISKIYVRKYSPLREYGGWGLRYGFGGKAYNIKGNMGFQINFKDSSNLLIGTQKAEELERVLEKLDV
jgi:hypothetical protein